MKVIVFVKASRNSEEGVMPTEKELSAMTSFNEELVKAGVMVTGEGLHPTSKGKRIRFGESGTSVEDGPFPLDESIAGFWIWNVKSMDEAVAWARRCPNPMPGEEGVLEIRPIFEAEDFGEELTPELREREERMRKQLGAD